MATLRYKGTLNHSPLRLTFGSDLRPCLRSCRWMIGSPWTWTRRRNLLVAAAGLVPDPKQRSEDQVGQTDAG